MESKQTKHHKAKKIILIIIFCIIVLVIIFLILARTINSNQAVFGKFSYLEIENEKIPFGIGYGEDLAFLDDKMYKNAIILYEKKPNGRPDIYLFLDKSIEGAQMNISYSSSCSSSPCKNYKNIAMKIFDTDGNLLTEGLLENEESEGNYTIHYQGENSEIFRVKLYNSIFKSDDQKIFVEWKEKEKIDELKLQYLNQNLSEFIKVSLGFASIDLPANIFIINNTPFFLKDVEIVCSYYNGKEDSKILPFVLEESLMPNTTTKYEYPSHLHKEPISEIYITSCEVTKATPVLE